MLELIMFDGFLDTSIIFSFDQSGYLRHSKKFNSLTFDRMAVLEATVSRHP